MPQTNQMRLYKNYEAFSACGNDWTRDKCGYRCKCSGGTHTETAELYNSGSMDQTIKSTNNIELMHNKFGELAGFDYAGTARNG